MGNAKSPILTFDEIVSAASLEQVLAIYNKKGVNFKCLDEGIKHLESDWLLERERLTQEALQRSLPRVLPRLETTVDGKTYRIYGVIHDRVHLDSGFKKVIKETIGQEPNLVYEDGLGMRSGNLKSHQMNDRRVPRWYHHAIFGVYVGIAMPRVVSQLLKNETTRIQPKKREERIKLMNISLEFYDRSLNGTSLPAYALIERIEQGGYKYKSMSEWLFFKPYVLDRSAYQAEFMRAWSKGTGQDTACLVGLGHCAQIKYYLEKGVSNLRIVEQAQHDVQDALEHPMRYSVFRFTRNTVNTFGMVGAGWIGMLPYITALDTLFGIK